MNFVFWLLVVAVLVAIWFLLAPYFKDFGRSANDLLEDTKKEIESEDDE